jgi:branched-chain amino acid transport system substrate-binding protein
MRKILSKRIKLFLVAFAAAACSYSVGAQTIKIGAPIALTGGFADEGHKQVVAFDLWLERVNGAGGINVGGKKMKVELVSYDYQTNEQRASQMAEKLIVEDKVQFLIAPFGSGHAKVVAGVAERYGVPVIAVSSSEPVHNQGYKYLFGTLSASSGLAESMFAYVKQKAPTTKKIAIIGRDDIFPKIMANLMIAQAPKNGIEIVYQGFYPVGSLDHSAILTAVKPFNPDWIYVSGYIKDLVLFRKQMTDLKIEAPIVTMVTGPAYKEFVDTLGPLAENVTSASWWVASAPFKGDDVFGSAQAYNEAVRKKTGQDADYTSASSAAAMVALQKAIEKAGSIDRDKVRQALTELNINTFFGPIKFREDGMNSARNLPLIQVQGGKPVVLYPAELAQGDLRLLKK